MNNKVLLDNLRSIPDFPKKGINFRDVTTLYQNAECVKIMLDELEAIYKDKGITKIVGIESRGFVMASALAGRLGPFTSPRAAMVSYTYTPKNTQKVQLLLLALMDGSNK